MDKITPNPNISNSSSKSESERLRINTEELENNKEFQTLKAEKLFQIIKEDENSRKRIINILSYLKSQKQIYSENELDMIFKCLDVDGDEKISNNEIKKFLKSLKSSKNDFDIKRMIDEFDHNNDGQIGKQEFFNRMNEHTNYGTKNDLNELLEIFKLFDVNSDKRITGHDLFHIMKAIGENFSEKDCSEMIRLLSQEKGYLDFPMFFDIIKDEKSKNIY